MSYKDNVLPIVRGVRDIVLPQYGISNITGRKTVHPWDIVTELDEKVESYLRRKLSEIYPEIEFVGEESGGNREAKIFWLVDPVDGTAHYVRGLPFCTTMIALIENGTVIFSVVYDFLSDKIYWAEKGKGAFVDDTRIHVSDREVSDAYISFETHAEKKENQPKLVELAREFCLFKTVSVGWELAMIASGKIDGRISFDPWGKDYDYAAGSLLVSEAGGIVVNIKSKEYNYKNLNQIAASPKVFRKLEKMFEDYELR